MARELARCELDSEVRWEKGGTRAGVGYTFSIEKENESYKLGILYFV
jgi:hypothetical protein